MTEIIVAQTVVPSSPADKLDILEAIKEIDLSLTRIDAERDLIKDIADQLKEDYSLPKRLVNRLAATYHKGNKEEVENQFQEYKEFYSAIVDGN